MLTLLQKLVANEAAQDLAEYGIALAVIAAGAGVVALAIGGNILALWNAAAAQVAAAV